WRGGAYGSPRRSPDTAPVSPEADFGGRATTAPQHERVSRGTGSIRQIFGVRGAADDRLQEQGVDSSDSVKCRCKPHRASVTGGARRRVKRPRLRSDRRGSFTVVSNHRAGTHLVAVAVSRLPDDGEMTVPSR